MAAAAGEGKMNVTDGLRPLLPLLGVRVLAAGVLGAVAAPGTARAQAGSRGEIAADDLRRDEIRC